MEDELPYRAEYSKSARASCRSCKEKIEKDVLRIAVMVQSPMFDGKVPHWYHSRCFFIKQKPKSIEDIAYFDSLRWEDQEKIKSKIANGGSTPSASGKASKKKKNNDFSIECAASSRAGCRLCEEKIKKGEVRIGKLDYDSEKAKRFGPMYRWHHVDCFVKVRQDLEFFDCIDQMSGFNTLSSDDKKSIRPKIPKIEGKRKAEDVVDSGPVKKPKTENSGNEDDEKKKVQNKKLFYYRDALQKNIKKPEMVDMLYHNDYDRIPTGESKILDVLTDMMVFGTLLPCEVCADGHFTYSYGKGYCCTGNATEFTKCINVVQKPKRRPFKVPDELKEDYPFLNKYKFKDYGPRVVFIRQNSETNNNNGADIYAKHRENLDKKESPLKGMKATILLKGEDKNTAKEKVEKLGGEVSSTVSKRSTFIICTAEFLDKGGKNLEKAKDLEIQCVPIDFLDEIEDGGALLMIKKKNMASWGADPSTRMTLKSGSKSSSYKSGAEKSMYVKSMPETVKVQLKGGAAVDPEVNRSNCHVYKKSGKVYSAVLGYTDLQRGTNSYYKLQVIECDRKSFCGVFRAWGRIGTTIGGNKFEDMEDINDCIKKFSQLYEEKTGNRFDAPEFNKLPGYHYLMDIDIGQDQPDTKIDLKSSKSKLADPIKKLVSMIFDIETMKSALVEFEIDLKKMPLGKISKKQIEKAYKVLSEAQKLVEELESKKDVKGESPPEDVALKTNVIDCSNRFYTLIPHDFGMDQPPLLNDEKLIQSKIEMLDSLKEIEIAYSLLKSEDEESKGMDPLDKHYKKLKTEMTVLDKKDEEFEMLQKYVKNTHAKTHSHYGLSLEQVFKIERQGEKKRFKPFKKLHNHQLLWHGSRLTNYAGILSQGLRIAPPEAPVTGYMFGKGVYFADMVSKSANYCCTSKQNPTGLLMLCDVALGDMYELKNAKNVTKLPAGKHSTKGLGRTMPDPTDTTNIENAIDVPLGKPIDSGVNDTALLYNEYIVYDVSQVNAKYLLQVKFDYKY